MRQATRRVSREWRMWLGTARAGNWVYYLFIYLFIISQPFTLRMLFHMP
jgi:hypothetical protein